MAVTITAVTFQAEAQRYVDGRFTIPQKICDLLKLRRGDLVALDIKTPAGTLPRLVKKLSSGIEIYGPDMREHVKAGDTITVTVSHPEEQLR